MSRWTTEWKVKWHHAQKRGTRTEVWNTQNLFIVVYVSLNSSFYCTTGNNKVNDFSWFPSRTTTYEDVLLVNWDDLRKPLKCQGAPPAGRQGALHPTEHSEPKQERGSPPAAGRPSELNRSLLTEDFILSPGVWLSEEETTGRFPLSCHKNFCPNISRFYFPFNQYSLCLLFNHDSAAWTVGAKEERLWRRNSFSFLCVLYDFKRLCFFWF